MTKFQLLGLLVSLPLMMPGGGNAQPILDAPDKIPLIDRCRMGECGWFKFKNVSNVGTNKDGQLIKATSVPGESKQTNTAYTKIPRIKWREDDEEEIYVFCSRKKPFYISMRDEKWRAMPLDPGNEAAIPGVLEGIYAVYYRLCHNFRNMTDGSTKAARKLGYPDEIFGKPTDGIFSKQPDDIPLDKPTDILEQK